MAASWKYRRLEQAADRFKTFNFFVDIITVSILATIVIAVANKMLTLKIVAAPFFDMSWKMIGILCFAFMILLFSQLQRIQRYRPLSDFELEAALKAAKDKRIPLRRR